MASKTGMARVELIIEAKQLLASFALHDLISSSQ